ncbi:MAG: PKD domain-containing protein, partial [bacterium]
IWDIPGTYEVQFRVTDDEGGTGELDEPMIIEIQNGLPIADASVDHSPPGSPVTIVTVLSFDGSGSVDGDCMGVNIANWEWDWENDGIFDAEGETQEHSYDTIGHYEVQLRVTDDEGATDLLDSPLEIDVVDFGWAITFGTVNGYTRGYDVASDSAGNVYTTGSCWYSVDFDPGPDESEPSKKGPFIASYDSAGRYRWSHSWNQTGSPTAGNGIVIDNDEYVYFTGNFAGTIDFDPGPDVDNHTADGAWDVLLMKFDTSGNYIWGKHWGHTYTEYGRAVAVGEGGKVFVAGTFEGAVDFDPSVSATHWHTALGKQDSFLSAFDSNGKFLWANAWGGNDPDPLYDYPWGVAGDQLGNVYVAGQFYGTADFDPGSGVSNLISDGDIDGYLVSYNAADGALIWAYAISSSGNYDAGKGVAVDDYGYVYLSGVIDDTCDLNFGPGVNNFSTVGWNDAFLAKYDWNGAYQWAYSWGCASTYTRAFGICLTSDGHVALGGTYAGSVDFDPGPGHSDWTSNGETDIFICYFSLGGTFGWAKAWGGSEAECSYNLGPGMASDTSGNIFTTGYFLGSVDFDPSGNTDLHEPPGDDHAAFISKFLPDGSW